MTNPIGSDSLKPLYVSDETQRNALIEEAKALPSVEVSSAAAANAVMLGGGYFNPFPSPLMHLALWSGVIAAPSSRALRSTMTVSSSTV